MQYGDRRDLEKLVAITACLINHLHEPGALKLEVVEYLERVQATVDPFLTMP